MLNETIKRIVNEELTKTQVETIVDDKIEKAYKKRDFEDRTRKIVADVLDDFFKNLWAKNNFWKSCLKR